MSRHPIFQVAAFANKPFAGNPASVVILGAPLEPEIMQAIAREAGQPATAFLMEDAGNWSIRWFTPTIELPLCGHATLAATWVFFRYLAPGSARLTMATQSAGELIATFSEGRIWLDFPSDPATASKSAEEVERTLGLPCREVLETRNNLLAVVDDPDVVRSYQPLMSDIAALPGSGLILSSRGDEGYDCVSRYFAPKKGVAEDAVTGSAHCTLAPYWSAKLGQLEIRAWQASPRGGELLCRAEGSRVFLCGNCIPFFEGVIDAG